MKTPSTGLYGTEVITCTGRVLMRSNNLRAMLQYAAVSPVVSVSACQCPNNEYNGHLRVFYQDGAMCSAHFASYGVLLEWLTRRRTWHRSAASWSIEGLALANIGARSIAATEKLQKLGLY